MSLHVAINALFLAQRAGGVGRYTRNLLRSLTELDRPPRLTVFAGSGLPAEVLEEPWAGAVDWVRLPVAPTNPLNLAAQLAALPLLARHRGADVLHGPANAGALWAPLATVVTLHDLIWLHHPEDWDSSRRARASTKALAVHTARASTRVIADSRAARDDFVATLGLDPARIDVVPLAADGPSAAATPERELRDRLGLGDGPFVLSVAQKRRYKRLDTLIAALPELAGDVSLVLAGPPAGHEPELRRIAAELGMQRRVHFLDWVEEADLEGLYRACACFALPTAIEGFGLPVLEAMGRGAPVACSKLSALPEVAGDAALYFDPYDQADVTRALARLLADPQLRDRIAAAGRRQAERFSWRRTAEETLATYAAAAAAGRRR
jgi:glycosyltransferase involved in cell wall biosynthesis